MNINDFDRLYRRKVTKTGDGSTTVRLELDRIEAHRIRVLTHVSLENKTTNYTKSRLGIKSHDQDLYLDEVQTIAAAELAVSKSDIVLGEGDIFFAELTGTTANDEIVMVCIGWEQPLKRK